jgi:hypothetical protein
VVTLNLDVGVGDEVGVQQGAVARTTGEVQDRLEWGRVGNCRRHSHNGQPDRATVVVLPVLRHDQHAAAGLIEARDRLRSLRARAGLECGFTPALECPPQEVQARHVAVRAEREEDLLVLRPVGLGDQGAVARQREGVVVEVLERSGRTVPPQHQRAVLD